MNLQPLCSAPHVTVYYDADNDWLYVEWAGELTLPVVQHACLEVAQCFLQHSYPRVLNSNSLVTGATYDVAPWLAHNFFPWLHLAGIQQLAWVVAPTLRAGMMAQQTVERLPRELAITLFSDEAEAVHWLQQTAPAEPASGCALPLRPAATEARLTRVVNSLEQLLLPAPPLTNSAA